jgi:hypothetical protein
MAVFREGLFSIKLNKLNRRMNAYNTLRITYSVVKLLLAIWRGIIYQNMQINQTSAPADFTEQWFF